MSSLLKHSRDKRQHSKKDKKLIKLIKSKSESEDEGSEHELSYYLNDRVKLMKEVLKIIKPRKIKSMAPDCMKSMDIEEINSMLLEELLGISNKRLKYIFNGQNLNEESSSTDPEDQPDDVISLDDISDDDLEIIDLDQDSEVKKGKKHRTRIKEEHKHKKIKKEKQDKDHGLEKYKREKSKNEETEPNPMSEKNLMSVLELLELQARARAIRSQLVLESTKPAEPAPPSNEIVDKEDSNEEDAVIVESPQNEEIVISSSDTEGDETVEDNQLESDSEREKNAVAKNKTKLIQKSTHKEGDQSSSSNWKNVMIDTATTNFTRTVRIIKNTTIKESGQNGMNKKSHDSVTDSSANSIPEIPLPKSKSKKAMSDVSTEIKHRQKCKNSGHGKETTDKPTFDKTEDKDNSCQTKSSRSSKTSKEVEEKSEASVDKLDNHTQQQESILSEDNSKLSAHVNRQKVSQENNENNSAGEDGEGIVLNADQSDIDCINID
ncbi:unnamed protein product [Diabrotica balteata]|uniref:Uncharacterized protein n=1 Tax=Diabrotica balteata TaxID=107213 RepID=A0A9N9X716_DIABA|nr:unnamed protein product [Diabrotica balteata]